MAVVKKDLSCRCWVKFLEAEKLKGRDSTYWFVSTLKLRDTQFRFLKMKFFAFCSDGFMGFLILKHTPFSLKTNMDLTRIPAKVWGRGTFCIRNSQEWTPLVLTTRNGFVSTKSLNMKTAAAYPSTLAHWFKAKANESAARCLEQVAVINP